MYQEQVYRAYVSEAVKIITKTVAESIGKEGAVYMAKSYTDIIYPPVESNKTATDIINNIKNKLKELDDGLI